jgi:hypothetical protein
MKGCMIKNFGDILEIENQKAKEDERAFIFRKLVNLSYNAH